MNVAERMYVTFDFGGQNFLVTGASSGIGRATAKELLASGATVLGLARHFPAADELAAYADRWQPRSVDVTDYAALSQAVDDFATGCGKFSGSVHAAGTAVLTPVNVWNHEQARAVTEVNVWAAGSLLKLMWKRKYHTDNFSHVFISSVSAHRGQKGLGVYGAGKAALEALVRTAAQELSGKGQRVNSVCLGWIEHTGMTRDAETVVPTAPLGGGTVADAAGIILFLLSDRARWITGANLVADGGYLS